MNRAILLSILLVTGLAAASDLNEVPRSKEDTYKLLKATGLQAEALHKIDGKYEPLLAKLRKEKPADYTVQRDALNDKYSREFMGAMTPIQKSSYRKYVRSLRQAFIKTHPDVDADNIFIWGGANII